MILLGNTLVENGYSSVRRTHDRPPQLPLRSASNPGSQDAVEGDIDLLYSRVSRNTAQTGTANFGILRYQRAFFQFSVQYMYNLIGEICE